ncbi:MAG: RNA polymerase sigma-54 factor, partial [Pseudomonadota bacterium]
EAGWLIRSLDQRQRTILKVATEIVRHQSAFLRHGAPGLRPLLMRDVADAIDMHESTVSRVVANKTLACPHGVVAMKAFFGSGLASSRDADGVSAAAVKARIEALIKAEDPLKPLSDDALTQRLQAEGTEIARRTVAKYREALGVASSSRRRRAAKLGA